MSHHRLRNLLLVVAVTTWHGWAAAQAFPSNPVRLVLPFAPGGTTDLLARIVAEQMGPALGQTMIVDNLPSALPFIKDKRLIAIVVAAPSRLASLPDMPTFAEVGLAPVNRMSFLGVSAPIGTPKDVLDKLNAAVRTDLADVAVKGRIEAAGAIVVGSSADDYQKQIGDELLIYQRVVQVQKLKLE
jgi:tripartite-type tricarboxylate transporter receptor subunit TctC